MLKKPGLIALVKTDFLSLFLSLLVLLTLVLAVWASFSLPVFSMERLLDDPPFERLTPDHARFFAGLAALGAILAPCVLWLRLRTVRRAFSGVRASGRITKITKFKDRAYLHYQYEHGGQTFQVWRFVHQSAPVRALGQGQEVEIAVDPSRPHAGWIVQLFE